MDLHHLQLPVLILLVIIGLLVVVGDRFMDLTLLLMVVQVVMDLVQHLGLEVDKQVVMQHLMVTVYLEGVEPVVAVVVDGFQLLLQQVMHIPVDMEVLV